MDNPAVYARYLEKQEEHRILFEKLMSALEAIADALLCVGGDLVHEWGARNTLWHNRRIKAVIKKLNMHRVYFDGCAVGLVSQDGRKIRKPWVFETTIPQVCRKFATAKCNCPNGSHARCKGKDALLSAFYTWKMTDWLHNCFRSRVTERSDVFLPSIESVLECKVKQLASQPGWHPLAEYWLNISVGSVNPKKLGRGFSEGQWPRRTTLALMDTEEGDDWICLEDDKDYRKPPYNEHYLFDPTTIATIYQPADDIGTLSSELHTFQVASSGSCMRSNALGAETVALDELKTATESQTAEQTEHVNNIETLQGASPDKSQESQESTAPHPKWVVSWGINEEDTVRTTETPTYEIVGDSFLLKNTQFDFEDEARFIQTAASAPGRLDALSVANRWIIDT
jgi:hypothetical protein